ncbi:MAG: hypothetical protein QOD78_2620 [Chloroflexota bacterium]|jgi:hypothetical protein|nr:hypothetical protein [Chloroflexota bacterium]MEA2613235.1 hypothetical protein [Chloroflexota bacterium]
MVLAAGCIGQSAAPTATPTALTAPSLAAPSVEPSAQPAATPEPVATPEPTAEPPTETPTVPPASGEPGASAQAGSAAACTGTAANRDFFAKVAVAFDWPVYCAVLPARWSVASGSYRSAGGGRMEIAYNGPGGARFELHEGAFCDLPEGCVPNGPDAGTAAFGDLSGTLVTGDDGSYAVVVDRGKARSWLAVGVGLDLDTFKGFAAGLVLVE